MRNRTLLLLVFCGLMAPASAQSTFDRFTFNVGGGVAIGRGDVADFVGNPKQFTVGGGMNFAPFHHMFGADAEYLYYGLGFKSSVKMEPGLADERGHMQAVTLNGIVNVPRHIGKLGAYGIFGIGFYDRSVSVPSFLVGPTTVFEPPYVWWDLQVDPSGKLKPQTMSSHSKIAGGWNYGGGITYRLGDSRVKLYMEYRDQKAYTRDVKTSVMPITVGLRW